MSYEYFLNNILAVFMMSLMCDKIGDILDFGQLFKAFGNNQFAPIFPILKQLL